MHSLTRLGTRLGRLLTLALLPGMAMATPTISEQEAYDIGKEAYYYLYPLITTELTRRVATNLAPNTRPGFGPANSFAHVRAFPPADFKTVVRPNYDTLYSSAWLDLSAGPMIVSTPDTAGRYYMLALIDMWTDVFAAPGKRTSGTEARDWAVVPPGWSGHLPDGVLRIDAPTLGVWAVVRTQTNGTADYPAVRQLQDGFKVTPLTRWGKPAKPISVTPNPAVDMKTPPMHQVNALSAAAYFALGSQLMQQHPAHASDWSQLARLARIGFVPGHPFDLNRAPPVVQRALARVPKAAVRAMHEKYMFGLSSVVNGWQMKTEAIGVYGNAYLKRAAMAMYGLGVNPPEEALYPQAVSDAEGKPLQGGERYVLHFDQEQMPPADAFWSLTAYDAEGFAIPNSLNRFALGDRDALQFNTDGSLDIHIQPDAPEASKTSNWLPSAQTGVFNLTMRLYAPKPQALDGRWTMPAIRRLP